MARLNDMMENDMSVMSTKEALIEALETLIEMVTEDVLTVDELEVLDEAIDFVSTDFGDSEEDLMEKRMSSKEKMAARKYRLKNKTKLLKIAKLKKRCKSKIAGKEDKLSCNSKGLVKRIDKARSKAARIGARSR